MIAKTNSHGSGLSKNLRGLSKEINLGREGAETRDGYGDALLEMGTDRKIIVLCADLEESTRVTKFKKRFPRQFVEVGVAEQNLVTVASGLAAVGKIPFASSFAVFCPGRCWEQIRTTICYNDRNVKLVGAHAGISVGEDGATHQALEDLALMRVLPNMVVIVPVDYEQTVKATQALAKFSGPAYLRFARSRTEQMTTFLTPFEIGKAQVFKDGKDIALIGAGPVVYKCLEAASLLQARGIDAMVVNCHTLKPLDEKTILAAAKKCGKVITVEEAQINGGLGGAVAEFLSENYPVRMKRIGVRDCFGESGSSEELLNKYGFSPEKISQEALKLVRR